MEEEIIGHINGIPVYSKEWLKYLPTVDTIEIYRTLKESDKKPKVNI